MSHDPPICSETESGQHDRDLETLRADWANRILAESLTEPLLRNAWIEAIKESGNAIVVPDGSTPFVQVPTPTE